MENNNLQPIQEIKEGTPQVQQKPAESPSAAPAQSAQASQKVELPPQASPIPVPDNAVIKREKGVLGNILIVTFIVLLLVGAGYFFLYRVKITIQTNPLPDKIFIDGKEIGVSKNIYLKPGEHTVELKKDGYVSVVEDKDFSVGQRVNYDFKLQGALIGQIVGPLASDVKISPDTKNLFFVCSNSVICELPNKDEFLDGKTDPIYLSNGKYTKLKSMLISNNGSFSIVQDTENVKLVDFERADAVNQLEQVIIPLSSAVSSITWNRTPNQISSEVNSKIIYDFKSEQGWNLFLADIRNSGSNLLLRLEETGFTNLVIDWQDSGNNLLMVGNEVGIFDLATRQLQKVEAMSDGLWGSYGPKGKVAAVINSKGEIFKIVDGKANPTGIKTNFSKFKWIDEDEALIIKDNRPVRFNFDTGTLINYAEIKGLSALTSYDTDGKNIFFADREGVKVSPLQEPGYQK